MMMKLKEGVSIGGAGRATIARLTLSVVALGSAGLGTPAPAQTASAPTVASATPAIDPAHRAAAQAVVDKVFPPGTYRKMMTGTMDKMMSSMADRMLDIPISDLARMGGVPEDKLHKLSPATARQVMKIVDPAFDQRLHVTMEVMMPAMVDLMDVMEPDVRAGVVDAYASHFTTVELSELARFFATPVGGRYAAQSMLVYTDPAVMDRMGQMIPKMMAAMPDIMKRVKAASDSLPPPPKPGTLTKQQKADLVALLGTDSVPAKQGQ